MNNEFFIAFFGVFRLAFTFGAVFLAPGYALSLLFFGPRQIDGVERLAVAVTSSVAISSLIAASLAWSIYGLHPVPFLVTVFAGTILLGLAGVCRWRKQLLRENGGLSRLRSPLLVVGSGVLIPLVVIGLTLGVAQQRPLNDVTEFYLAPNFVRYLHLSSFPPGSEINLPIVIVGGNGFGQDVIRAL